MKKQVNQFFSAFFSIVLLFSIASCANQSPRETTDEVTGDSVSAGLTAEPDTIIAKFTDQETIRVVPGNSIGDFLIDHEIEESNLFNRLGEVDSSDAAMCKSWSMWYFSDNDQVSETNPEFDVYASCDPDLDMRKSIRVMRLRNIEFALDNGISLGTDLSVLKENYPEGRQLSFTHTNTGNPVIVYDDLASGVAFEITDSKVRAVIVHTPDQEIQHSYLPFYKQ